MSELVSSEQVGAIALITIDHPPVNALSHAVRSALLQAVVAADEDSAVRAIVIIGAGSNFVAGADIREFDAPRREPLLNDVLLRVEACRKPVVAAMQGFVLGGGMELALACHYRCARAGTTLGLPEVKLGLLPGAGGTQRLPRLIGVRAALEMMLGGEPISVARAGEIGLIDRLLEGEDLAGGALEYARELLEGAAQPRRLRERAIDPSSVDAGFFAEQRKLLARLPTELIAPRHIVQCVESCLTLPFDEALTLSRELFEQCRASVASRALRHLFFAERGTGAAVGDATPWSVSHVAVIGAGTMGSGIAISLATSGYEVSLIDLKPEALAAASERIRSTIEASAAKGRLSSAAAAQAIARVRNCDRLSAARDAQLVIEAVFESLALKQDVFRELDGICSPGTVIATNTSTLDVDAIASATSRPQDVVGMHFFSPANIMRLVEVVRGQSTAAEVIATVLAVSRRMRKIGVVVGNCFGFVGNRMLYGYGRENQLMLLEGVPPERIDRVLRGFGMAMGPNAVGDLAGLDVGYRVRRERKDLPDDPRYYRVADLLVEHGRHGQKTGKGMFRYEPGSREPIPDPEVQALIRAEAGRLGVEQREVSDEEIIERCVYALINEAARILEEGIAAIAADIDVIWVNGYGFPRHRGGPMFHADTVGLERVLARIREFESRFGSQYWTPAPLLVQLVGQGRTLNEWQGSGQRR